MTDYLDRIICGDCLEIMASMPESSVDSIVTDPPYGLSFMGKDWDHGVPGEAFWREALRVAKPGAHLLAFGGTRTHHRLMCAIEDAGWEIRDCLGWLYGSGFPKSLDVSKAIDKHGGAKVAWFGPWFREWRESHGIAQKQVAELFPSKSGGLTGCVANWELGFNMPTPEQFNLIRDTFRLPFDSLCEAEREVIGRSESTAATGGVYGEYGVGFDITAPATPEAVRWNGWGTALKPAWEPIVLARKPLIGTVAQNVLEYGTGALNIDGCRVGGDEDGSRNRPPSRLGSVTTYAQDEWTRTTIVQRKDTTGLGRFPANLIHDGSDDVLAVFPESKGQQGDVRGTEKSRTGGEGTVCYGEYGARPFTPKRGDAGSASRFFYCAKASASERGEGNTHPTVKPQALMQYLCRLVTPPGGVVLDPFAGSGSTLLAALKEGFRFIGIEQEEKYCEIARRRVAEATPSLFAAS